MIPKIIVMTRRNDGGDYTVSIKNTISEEVRQFLASRDDAEYFKTGQLNPVLNIHRVEDDWTPKFGVQVDRRYFLWAWYEEDADWLCELLS